MAGVLNFTLGMANGGFLSGITGAQRGISGLIGSALKLTTTLGAITGLGAGVAGVFKEISEGARLFDLSRRTKETVENLFAMEHAMEDVGVSANSLPALISSIQKSLGGFNEMGEPTKDVFAAIGLGVEDLKELNAPQQLLEIGKALAALPKEEAMNFASKISRGGAGELIQIARSANDFAAAMERAAPQAALMARNAAAFDRISDIFTTIRLQSRGLFLGIAEGAAPAIQGLLDQLNSFDLTGVGQKMGSFIAAIGQAFKEGKIGDFISLSFAAGFEQSYQIFQVFLGTVSQGLMATLGSADLWIGFFNSGLAAVGNLANEFMDLLTPLFAFGRTTLTLQSGNSTWEEDFAKNEEMFRKNRQEARESLAEWAAMSGEVMRANLPDFTANMMAIFGKGFANIHKTPAWIELERRVAEFSKRAGFGSAFEGIPGGINDDESDRVGKSKTGGRFRTDANPLERIGLVTGLGGERNTGMEHHRKTAHYSQKTYEILLQIHKGQNPQIGIPREAFQNI